MKANVAEEFEPTVFCAAIIASFKVVLTFEDMAPLIVELRGIDPVILGRVVGRVPCFAPAVVVDGFTAEVVFLELVLLTCPNTSEWNAVKSIPTANATTAIMEALDFISRFIIPNLTT